MLPETGIPPTFWRDVFRRHSIKHADVVDGERVGYVRTDDDEHGDTEGEESDTGDYDSDDVSAMDDISDMEEEYTVEDVDENEDMDVVDGGKAVTGLGDTDTEDCDSDDVSVMEDVYDMEEEYTVEDVDDNDDEDMDVVDGGITITGLADTNGTTITQADYLEGALKHMLDGGEIPKLNVGSGTYFFW